MDALFVVVAKLLFVPMVLWGLLALELSMGLAASFMSLLIGRRSAKQTAQATLTIVRRRLLWTMIMLSGGLLLADLVFFDALVGLALGSIDDREELQLRYESAEGSFILGRIELDGLTLEGTRGGEDPSARFAVEIDSLVIDIDTAKLLTARFAVEELAADGVVGSFDRLRRIERPKPEDKRGFQLERDFAVERLHFGEVELLLRDHTKAPLPTPSQTQPSSQPDPSQPREYAVVLDELDVGPLYSNTALFDLLYRVRGRGSVAGLDFVLTTSERGDVPQTTLEVRELPLALIAEPAERATGIRIGGSAGLTVVDRYRDDSPEARVDLAIDLSLRELSLAPGQGAGMAAKLMLQMAARTLEALGPDFPLHIELTLLRSELEGVRSLADSGILESVSESILAALREELASRHRAETKAKPELVAPARPTPNAPSL